MVSSTDVTSADREVAQRVLRTFLLPRAQPPQLQRQFQSIGRCHFELRWMGFRLQKKQDHYGGPRTEVGLPVAAMLLWTQGRVLVRIKTRGEPATGRHRQGLAHMSVCLLDGRMSPDGRIDTSFAAEEGKFDAAGRLVAKTPKAVIAGLEPWAAKSAAEEWSDNTHFLFPDLVCDDSEVDRLLPDP